MTEAFRRLGHTVYHVGQETGRAIWGLEVPEEYAWCQELPPDGWQPDLCILMDTAYQWHHETVPTVLYTVDNHVRDVRQEGILHYFLGHKTVSIMPYSDNCTWLPCGYDPTLFTPSQIPYQDRKYDVACLGVIYPQRYALIQQLIDAGLKVIWGCGLVYDGYVAAYHDARISLCASVLGDVAQRVFESAAMGCVVMTDRCLDFDILKPIGFWMYDREKDIVSEVKQVLADPDRAQGEISWSQAWAQPHTWDARAKVIVEWYEKARG